MAGADTSDRTTPRDHGPPERPLLASLTDGERAQLDWAGV